MYALQHTLLFLAITSEGDSFQKAIGEFYPIFHQITNILEMKGICITTIHIPKPGIDNHIDLSDFFRGGWGVVGLSDLFVDFLHVPVFKDST
jgi:hypothetical protein